MLKITRFAKKYWYLMLMIFALLGVQAFCELSLPQYTANIVDVGIQYGGIENPIPDVIREESLNKLLMFVDENDREIVKTGYQLKDDGYHLDYDNLGNDKITRKEKFEELKDILLPAEISYTYATYADNTNSNQAMESNMGMAEGEMSDEMLEMMGEAIGISFVKSEYEAMGIDLEALQMDYVKSTGIKMLCLSMIGMVAAILVGYLASLLSARTGRDLRNKVFNKIISFSNAEIDNFSSASLITRCTNDIQQVQMVTMMLFRMVAYAPIMAVGGIVKVVNSNMYMAWIIAVAVAAIMMVVGVLMFIAMPKFKKMQELVDRLNLVTREMLTGIPVIRAFSKEKYEEKRFEGASKDLMKTQLFTNRVMTFMMPTMMLIMNGITVLIIWVVANGIDTGNIQVGDMMAFITYTMMIVMSFLMITMISVFLPRASVAADRIQEVLDTKEVIEESKEPVIDEEPKGLVEFDNVSFRYPNAKEDVLENISFTAKPGETTAIIGSTGCGKSTLVHLIPRLYDVTGGRITIDGIDIRDMKLHDVRDIIGFVPQKATLFSGTINSNIKYGADWLSEDEVIEVAKVAQAMEFIETKPEKFESPIAQGGANVSGGQKQRLSIARAIAKNPKIYVFDDSFSALDYKTDTALRKALSERVKDAAVIIVAQRISTIKNAEKIIVLDEGKVAGIGTHKELLKTNEVYNQIAASQFSQEELEKERLGE